MHSSLSIAIGALSFLTASIAASAHPVPSASIWSTTSPLVVGSDQTDALTHAAFNFTCQNCLSFQTPRPQYDLLELPFDLVVLRGEGFCTSTLSLNGAAFAPSVSRSPSTWTASEDRIVQASGHDLAIDWYTTCGPDNQSAETPSAAHVVTVKLKLIDGHKFAESAAVGFTISFKENSPPEFLRLASAYTHPETIDESWTNPPSSLRLTTSPREVEDSALRLHIEDLHYLEAEAELIQDLIAEKKKLISDRLHQDLKTSISQCKGVLCYFEVVYSHAHKSVTTLYHHHKPNPYSSFLDPQGFVLKGPARQSTMSTAVQNRTMSNAQNLPSVPNKCHCKEGEVVSDWPELPERPATGRSTQRTGTSNTSSLSIVLSSFFAFTGLAFLFSCFRNCCCTRRKKSNRRDPRQRVSINRDRKRGFWAWVSRKKAEKHASRVSRTYHNIDEKRDRVDDQEKVLEGYMQEEIQQLQIHEELRQLQNTRNQVDELIRAEEGRYHAAPPYSSEPQPSTHGLGTLSNRSSQLSRYSIPRPLDIPPRPHSDSIINQHGHPQALLSSSSSSDNPFSPISRTTSLPSYRSKPPSYQGDGESSYAFSDSDGMSDGESDQGHWTESDDSSLPDLSPRPSGETLPTQFTGETARTFL